MKYKAISYDKIDDLYTVKLEREKGQFFYVDVWVDKKYHDVECDWNQYMFSLDSDSDMERMQIQKDSDEFDDASSVAICFLEQQGCVTQDNAANWFATDDDLEDLDIEEPGLDEFEVDYDVWLLGRDATDDISFFYLVRTVQDSDKALDLAKTIVDKGNDYLNAFNIPDKVKYVDIVVERAIDVDDERVNLGNIFEKTIERGE